MGEISMPSAPNPSSLLIFTSFSNPLPRKYPHPHKPSLLIPPLIHRTLHTALDKDPPSTASTTRGLIIPHPDYIIKHDLPALPKGTGSDRPDGPTKDVETTLDTAQPTSNVYEDGLSRHEDTDAEVTVKLHLVGPSPPSIRAKWIAQALDALGTYKGLGEIDTLLVGFRGVDYKGKKSAVAEMFGCGAEGMENGSGGETVDEATGRDVEAVWRALVGAKARSTKGHVPNGYVPGSGVDQASRNEDLEDAMAHVKSLGTLYMPLGLLESLSKDGQAPCINSMDTPDCHHLPKEYTGFAKEEGIELWAGGGGEGSDPMPSAELHNVLQEFNGTLTPLLPSHDRKKPILEQLIPLRDDGLKYEEDVKSDVCVNWVLGYTLVSKTRNVLKDKGYIVCADWKI